MNRRMRSFASVVLSLALCAAVVAGCHARKADDVASPAPAAAEAAPKPVTVELFVMSRCPYSVQAEDALFPALDTLGDAVDFRLHFVGGIEVDGSLSSMHGDDELRGDLLQACAGKVAPKAMRALIDCMNRQPEAIPDNFADCATKAGVDAAAVTACADGEDGKALLKASFEYADQLGVQGSPTMGIAGQPFEGPRTTASYLRAICGAYEGARPGPCASLPPPVEVLLTVLTDVRCQPCVQAIEAGVRQMRTIFPGLKDRTVEIATDEGKALYATMRAADQKFVPAFLFGEEVVKDPSFGQIEKYFETVGNFRMLIVDAGWDPTAEICDNTTDDDGNGKADCADPGCKGAMSCRPEKKRSLEVFVMSQCPYGIIALDSMKEVLEAFGKKMAFGVHYIVDAGEDGGFESLHGPAEVEEDLRQACAVAKYARDNRFMDYILCRNRQQPGDPDWKACAKGAIKATVIEKCATGPEGKKLLARDAVLGEELGVNGSPTWLVNNRHPESALAADEIREVFCRFNDGTPGCEKTLSKDARGAPAGGGCQAE